MSLGGAGVSAGGNTGVDLGTVLEIAKAGDGFFARLQELQDATAAIQVARAERTEFEQAKAQLERDRADLEKLRAGVEADRARFDRILARIKRIDEGKE
jgi:hypothetical protein